ncbi:class I SAM-dependent methyltransferase [Actinomyces radicidentis]|uniref:class I SAM-dependent methyltransferase n=1 Tax=Actinomyces radicidentis TaxID=111015 RepID=UPI0028E52C10|nr:class I SAM-dependent methyltransferase [Actinomyces radicidentis]
MSSARQGEWEERYASVDRLWSGRPNDWLPQLAADWVPGRALDLGCGEGDDALWLAARGWDVTGVDLSATAIGRMLDGARAAGVEGRVHGVVLDLVADPLPAGPFDLVTSFYVHGGPSPESIQLPALLAEAASRVAPGGRLLVAVHCVNPPWHRHCALTYGPGALREEIGEAVVGWGTVVCEERWRDVLSREGESGRRSDAVLCLRRPV